jgi:ParB-like chromosome segregation protein Spo0J
MSDEQFRALVDDIDMNGVRSPILIYQGKIIDGWHRYKACLELNVKKMRMADWDGEDPVAFVLSQNLHRRHLNPSQRSFIFAELAEWSESAGRPSKSLQVAAMTLEKAAELTQVSMTTMKAAKAAINAEPEVQEAVKQGRMSVTEAAKLSKQDPETQKKAAKEPKEKKQSKAPRQEMVPLEEYQMLETNYIALSEELAACSAVKESREVEELRKLQRALNSMTAARDQWQNKCSEMTRQNNYLSSRVKKLEKENEALRQK